MLERRDGRSCIARASHESGARPRHSRAMIVGQIQYQMRSDRVQIAVRGRRISGHNHVATRTTATRKPWCERPHLIQARGHPPSPAPGSFTPRLALHRRRRGVLAGGKKRRPIAAMPSLSASLDSSSRRHARMRDVGGVSSAARWPEWLRTTYAVARSSPSSEPLLNPARRADERGELQVLVGEFGEFDPPLAALELVSEVGLCTGQKA